MKKTLLFLALVGVSVSISSMDSGAGNLSLDAGLAKIEKIRGDFLCFVCSYKSPVKGNVKRHFRLMHSDDRPLKCNICDQSFKIKGHFEEHLQRHEGAKKYVCSIEGCGATRNTYTDLKAHERRHCSSRRQRRINVDHGSSSSSLGYASELSTSSTSEDNGTVAITTGSVEQSESSLFLNEGDNTANLLGLQQFDPDKFEEILKEFL